MKKETYKKEEAILAQVYFFSEILGLSRGHSLNLILNKPIKVKEALEDILATLSIREERVIKMRFGIGFSDTHTLEEVGKDFSVTRERVRQIEIRALRLLKSPFRRRRIHSYLGFGDCTPKEIKTVPTRLLRLPKRLTHKLILNGLKTISINEDEMYKSIIDISGIGSVARSRIVCAINEAKERYVKEEE